MFSRSMGGGGTPASGPGTRRVGAAGGEPPGEPGGGYALRKRAQAGRAARIDPYDFTQAEKFSPDQWRILNRMATQFAEELAPKLTPLLQSRVIVEFWELRSLSFREYMDFLPAPTPIAVFLLDDRVADGGRDPGAVPHGGHHDHLPSDSTGSPPGAHPPVEGSRGARESRGMVDPLLGPGVRGRGMWVLDALLSFMLVDRLLGGRGEPSEEIRELTHIEQAVLRKNLFATVLETFVHSWRDLGTLHSRLETIEFEPQQVILAPYGEPIVVFSFRMKVGIVEGVWELALPFKFLKQALPHTSFEEFLTKSAGTKGHEQPPSPFFSKKIEVGKLPVAVEVGRADIPFQDLLSLEVGDIIRLDSLLGSAFKIKVSGRTKFLGKPGLRDNKLAVQVTSVVDEGDESGEE